jgi:hypothetical protein
MPACICKQVTVQVVVLCTVVVTDDCTNSKVLIFLMQSRVFTCAISCKLIFVQYWQVQKQLAWYQQVTTKVFGQNLSVFTEIYQFLGM